MSVILTNPVAVYTAATNADAQLVSGLLTAAGIDAYAIDDISPGGMYSLGTLSELHRPQVFVDRSRVDEAIAFLNDYESHSASETDCYCYHCGALCSDSEAECPSCHESLDWGNSGADETNHETHEESPGHTSPMSLGRRIKKPIAFIMLVPALIWLAGLTLAVARMILSLFLD